MDGVHAVVPTVFHDDGSLDLGGLADVVDAYGRAGVSGLIVLGVMGEVDTLDADERRRVVTTVHKAGAGLPVVVGLGAPGEGQLPAARAALDLGADLLLAGLAAGTEEERTGLLARLCDLGVPVVAQHHPAASGVRVPHEEVVRVVVAARAAAVKAESPPTPDLVAALVDAGGPPAFGGLSALTLLEELEVGAVGSMTGLATPELLVRTVTAAARDDATGAHDTYLRMAAYLRLEAMPGTVGLAVRKEAWRQRGVIASSRIRRGGALAPATKRAIGRRLRDAGVDVPAAYPAA